MSTDEELLIRGVAARTIISNAHRLLRRKYTRTPLWALVADITGYGSTYATRVCRTADLDPHQNAGMEHLKDCPKDN